jgi:hypothetical protein
LAKEKPVTAKGAEHDKAENRKWNDDWHDLAPL